MMRRLGQDRKQPGREGVGEEAGWERQTGYRTFQRLLKGKERLKFV